MDTASKLRGRDSGGKVTAVIAPSPAARASARTWEELDERVNEYPSDRVPAIGEGGSPSPRSSPSSPPSGAVDPAGTSRPSKKGKYVSANVVARLEKGEEVIAVYSALKACERVVWYL